MDRRSFLRATLQASGGVALAGGVAATPALAREAPVLQPGAWAPRIAVADGGFTPGPASVAVRMAARLATVTGGHQGLEIDLRSGTAAGLAAVRSGEVDGAIVGPDELAALDPAFAVFTNLPDPYAPVAPAAAAWLAAGGGRDLLDDLAADHGLAALVVDETGPAPLLWFAPGRSPALAGRRVATAGIAAGALARIGASAVAVPTDRFAAALAAGEVDAVEAGALTALATGLPALGGAVAGGLNGGGTRSLLVVARKVWEEAGDAAREALALVAEAERGRSFADQAAHRVAMQEMLAVSGRAVEPLGERALFRAAVAAEVEALARLNARCERIVASYLALAGDAREALLS